MTVFRRRPDSIFALSAVFTAALAVGQGFASDIWFHWLWMALFAVATTANVILVAGGGLGWLSTAGATTVTALVARPVGILVQSIEGTSTSTVPRQLIGIALYLFCAVLAKYVYERTAVRRAGA